mgnify:CR=1 FL=1
MRTCHTRARAPGLRTPPLCMSGTLRRMYESDTYPQPPIPRLGPAAAPSFPLLPSAPQALVLVAHANQNNNNNNQNNNNNDNRNNNNYANMNNFDHFGGSAPALAGLMLLLGVLAGAESVRAGGKKAPAVGWEQRATAAAAAAAAVMAAV